MQPWAKPDLEPVLTELSRWRGSTAEGGSDPCVWATLGAVPGRQSGLPKELVPVSDPEEEAVWSPSEMGRAVKAPGVRE